MNASGGVRLRPRTARELAFRVLEVHRESGAWVQDLLAEEWSRGPWSAVDKGFVNELVCGIVRRRDALTTLIRPAIQRPWDKVEPALVTLLHLGAYQLAYLDRVPPFAAIHETVELARSLGQVRWTGFVNGVLRTVSRQFTGNVVTEPAASALPVGPGTYRELQVPLFPDPRTELASYVAQAWSFPAWLAERWASRFDRVSLIDLVTTLNRAPSTYVRVNRRRIAPEALQQQWREAGIACDLIDGQDALLLRAGQAVEELPGYREGLFSPQDLTAMKAAVALGAGPDDRIWDVCAAPGTKTCHLAELRDDHGVIVATDVRADRLHFVEEGAGRLGLSSIRSQQISADGTDLPTGPFEAILLDAPCTNTGVLHRRPEARWRIQPQDVAELSSIQSRLLHLALDRLAPGGRLLYSTCSLEPEENQDLVAKALKRNPGLELCSSQAYLPGADGDGGFQALLVRRH